MNVEKKQTVSITTKLENAANFLSEISLNINLKYRLGQNRSSQLKLFYRNGALKHIIKCTEKYLC